MRRGTDGIELPVWPRGFGLLTPASLLLLGAAFWPLQALALGPGLVLNLTNNNSVAALSLTGTPQKFFRIDASTNLTDWTALALLFNTNGTAQENFR